MDDGEGQFQRFYALIVEALPGHRTAKITALRRRLGCREGFRAFWILERFPIGQAWALLLHVERIPPLFLGLGAEHAELFGLTRCVRRLHGFARCRVPEFEADREVAIGKTGGEAR